MAARPALEEYNRKRDFGRTAEPKGKRGRSEKGKLAFLVQKHAARRLHYDLRLEWNGVLLSWAVTKGPSLDPREKRLAVRTEDHPKDYGDFEGTIPAGEYGGGTVMLWDQGTWEPLHDPDEGLREGKLHFVIHGRRMTGGWALVRMRGTREKRENWLLVKERDEVAEDAADTLVETFQTSVASGRSMDEIAEGREQWTREAGRSLKPKPKPKAKPRPTSGAARRLPAFRKPQLATLVDAAPEGDEWLHEVKFDGYRCIAAVAGGNVRCYSRSGLDWTDRFAPVAEALRALDCDSALIDGEVVAKAEGNGSEFSALQKALGSGGALTYYVFDLLSLDGDDLAPQPLGERKRRLHDMLERSPAGPVVQFSEHVQGSGPRVLSAICEAGHEGIVSKRADAPYRHARTRSWLKVKCGRRQEFVIGGWARSDKKGRPFSSLLLGTIEDGRLRYRGKVGAGYSADMLDRLAALLKANARSGSPFEDVPRPVARQAGWVEPRHVAEVSFTELTDEGHIRHGVFLGLREDKEARDVSLEQPDTGDENGRVVVRGIALTNPDRVLYPDQGMTKRDLVAYFDAVVDRMMPLIQDRPLSLVRCPQGSEAKCFFQKHASQGFPEALAQIEIEESSGERKPYLFARNASAVIAAVQMGTLELHIWGSRADKLEKPDRLVFDLDPDAGIGFDQVKQAASDVRDRLSDLGLASWPLVTGGKGVHVVAPLRRSAEWDEVKDFARAFAHAMTDDEPDRFIATMSKAKRKGKIFIDWLRNERGATAIAPYSTRARPGAPVALPIGWDELATLKAANGFAPAAVIERLADPDPWAAPTPRQAVTKAMRARL